MYRAAVGILNTLRKKQLLTTAFKKHIVSEKIYNTVPTIFLLFLAIISLSLSLSVMSELPTGGNWPLPRSRCGQHSSSAPQAGTQVLR